MNSFELLQPSTPADAQFNQSAKRLQDFLDSSEMDFTCQFDGGFEGIHALDFIWYELGGWPNEGIELEDVVLTFGRIIEKSFGLKWVSIPQYGGNISDLYLARDQWPYCLISPWNRVIEAIWTRPGGQTIFAFIVEEMICQMYASGEERGVIFNHFAALCGDSSNSEAVQFWKSAVDGL